ncbi:putative F-box domain-containing protein [Tanacetum coccineum]
MMVSDNRSNQSKMADYIPLHIQVEIMKRLPVISLIRFRSVSKQWKSVIDGPEFIADHCVIQHHTQSHRHLLLSYLESGVPSVVRYLSIVDDDDTFPHQKALMTSPMSVNFFSQQSSFVAVSGGLFCMYGSIRNVMNAVIWNPSIRKSVTIAVPNAPDNDDDSLYKTVVGFRVCPQTSDPKLVKITYNTMYEEEYATIPNQVEVFSLSSGLWKPLPTGKLPRKSIVYINPQVAINDFIYWLVYDLFSFDWKDQCYRFIMSFDFTREEFTEVYLPQSFATPKTHVSISNLNNSLVILEKNHHSNANVWIMQNGDPKSFTPIFTIHTPITSISDVAGFRMNGAPLLSKKKSLKERELIVYEPNSKQINYTGIAGPFGYFLASPYTPTLLLLDHKHSVDSDTAGKQGTRTRSGRFRRLGRTLKGATSSSSAASSSTSYYGASKRYSQEEVNELVKKKCKIIGKRISASFNKKLVNLMTQLAEKGISLDKTPGIGEEDEEYEECDDEAMEDVWNEAAGLKVDGIDFFEINEAFASQFVYCSKKLQLDPRKVNVNGGVMAIGHPLGATRACCIATLLHEVKRRGKDSHFGVVSMCIGSNLAGHVPEDEEDAKTS